MNNGNMTFLQAMVADVQVEEVEAPLDSPRQLRLQMTKDDGHELWETHMRAGMTRERERSTSRT